MLYKTMILYIIIFLLVTIVIFSFLRIDHISRKIKITFLIIIIALLILSFFTIVSTNKSNLKSPSGIIKATTSYFSWMGKTIANLWDVGAEMKDKVIEAVKHNETG